ERHPPANLTSRLQIETLRPVFPFTDSAEDRLDHIGENQLVRFIGEWLGAANPPCPRGIGDDTAVLPPPGRKHLLFTNDSLIWGRHFDESASASEAGAKLLKRNLSDIAAMGGRPLHALLALSCGSDLSLRWLSDFFEGLAHTALTYNCEINGGDVSQAESGTFGATLSLLGECDGPVVRTGGETESWIWTTGSLGGSILGHHLSFTPRLDAGEWLANRPETLAMMDITDGLSQDLPKMIPEGLQARIDLSRVPVSDAARAAAQDTGKPAVWHAFNDGEDYELLFITRPGIQAADFESSWKDTFKIPLATIGSLHSAPPPNGNQPSKVVGLDGGKLFAAEGFEHFRTQ
ncbi:MAG: thiamine-phosphate kinase, partial [Puniceicoccales bacterium]